MDWSSSNDSVEKGYTIPRWHDLNPKIYPRDDEPSAIFFHKIMMPKIWSIEESELLFNQRIKEHNNSDPNPENTYKFAEFFTESGPSYCLCQFSKNACRVTYVPFDSNTIFNPSRASNFFAYPSVVNKIKNEVEANGQNAEKLKIVNPIKMTNISHFNNLPGVRHENYVGLIHDTNIFEENSGVNFFLTNYEKSLVNTVGSKAFFPVTIPTSPLDELAQFNQCKTAVTHLINIGKLPSRGCHLITNTQSSSFHLMGIYSTYYNHLFQMWAQMKSIKDAEKSIHSINIDDNVFEENNMLIQKVVNWFFVNLENVILGSVNKILFNGKDLSTLTFNLDTISKLSIPKIDRYENLNREYISRLLHVFEISLIKLLHVEYYEDVKDRLQAVKDNRALFWPNYDGDSVVVTERLYHSKFIKNYLRADNFWQQYLSPINSTTFPFSIQGTDRESIAPDSSEHSLWMVKILIKQIITQIASSHLFSINQKLTRLEKNKNVDGMDVDDKSHIDLLAEHVVAQLKNLQKELDSEYFKLSHPDRVKIFLCLIAYGLKSEELLNYGKI